MAGKEKVKFNSAVLLLLLLLRQWVSFPISDWTFTLPQGAN